MRQLSVGLLEDAWHTTKRIKQALQERLPDAEFRSFESRPALESAWESGYRPDALIVDLLVPEKHRTLVQIILGAPRSWIKRKLYPSVKPAALKFANWRLPTWQLQLERALLAGRDTGWGGFDFLRHRVYAKDASCTQFLIYSLSANTTLPAELGRYKVFATRIMKELESGRVDLRVQVFAKGWEKADPDRLRHDELPKLINALASL